MSLEPGAVLATAVLGPCVGGVVRTWTEAESRLWSPEDPSALRELMGRGLLARTQIGPDRFREVGLLDAASGTLALVPRFPSATDADGMTLDGRMVALGEATAVPESVLAELERYLADAITSATESGERLVVETGSAWSPGEPWVEVTGDAAAAVAAVASWGVEPWDAFLTFWRPGDLSAGG